MIDDKHPNRRILEATVEHLGPLVDEVVFLGGCATNLLITDPATAGIRVTYDVDVITEVASYIEYHALGKKLRAQGFREARGEDQTGVICRWRHGPLMLDVMPTDERILGFGNRWYSAAAATAQPFRLTKEHEIRLISPAYFLATKLEAFDNRGDNDFLASHDIEDIISVIDGRSEWPRDFIGTNQDVARYLAVRFGALLAASDFVAAIPGHLPPDAASQQRAPLILDRIQQIISATEN